MSRCRREICGTAHLAYSAAIAGKRMEDRDSLAGSFDCLACVAARPGEREIGDALDEIGCLA
jgi:hypothetical protein